MSEARNNIRAVSALLALCMFISLLPMQIFSLDTAMLEASLAEAGEYTDFITINHESNDPATVVKNFKTHFTWDNEKRENSKDYLFDWSYYNGVVFEGIEYLYEVTGKEVYKDYVVEYMSSLINADGTWATCTNNSSKQCAGYNSTHGGDCYKTASLLLDAYEMTGDNRYLTMAATLYADLDTAANSYSLTNAGNNYRHTWSSDPSPDLWLDGLYMILPFRAEYAKYIGDTEELDLIVSRMQWVSDNMYNSSKGLFYHAADSASSNSGTYWLRSIGWYAAAIVDIMDSMEGDNLQAMNAQLVKLVDGMKTCQNASNGMWLNNMAASESDSNPYETSGTSLVCYAVMKAVNNGWLDESYADMAILAFNGICNEKLSDNNLTDICFKGAPGSSNSTFYDNEGKGLGPFIMFYAEVLEYYNDQTQVPETTAPIATEPAEDAVLISLEIRTEPTKTKYFLNDTLDLAGLTVEAKFSDGIVHTLGSSAAEGYSVTADTGALGERELTVSYTWKDVTLTDSCKITVYQRHFANDAIEDVALDVTVPGVTAVAFRENSTDKTVKAAVGNRFDQFVSYDITPTGYSQGDSVTVILRVPDDFTVNELEAFTITDGTLTTIPGTYNSEAKTYSFIASHFSTYGIGEVAAVSGTGNLVGGIVYTLDTDGVTANKNYLIVNTSNNRTGYALTNNGSNTPERTAVTISNNQIIVDDDSKIAWVFSGSTSGTAKNSNRYIYLGDNVLSTSNRTLTIDNRGNGAYWIYASIHENRQWKSYYLRYNNQEWQRTTSQSTVYLYELTSSSSGEAVTFTVTPGSGTLVEGQTLALTVTVTVGGKTVDLSNCTIAWDSDDINTATVSGGTVTAAKKGTTNITATLSAVNGTALQENIELIIPVSVSAPEVVSVTANNTNGLWTFVGQDADFSDVTLTIEYNNGTSETIPYQDIVFVHADAVGTQTVTATYGDNSVTFPIQVRDLRFALSEEQVHVQPDGTVQLTGTVLVDGTAVDPENCVIEWDSYNESIATVSNGTVTGVQEGGTTVTATLTEVNGIALSTPIELQAGVTVANKPIVSAAIQGSIPDVKVDGTPDYSGVSVVVTYEDGTTGTIHHEKLDFSSVDTSVPGFQNVTVTYGSYSFNLGVQVGFDYEDLDPANPDNAPQYPDDGAVRIDKTATELDFDNTGIVEVELDVAGISVQSAVDVILIMDISNSMSWDDTEYDYNDVVVEEGSNQRLNIAKASAKEFINNLMAENSSGSSTNNSVTLLAFAGIDGDYNTHATAADNDDVYQVGDLHMTDIDDATAAIDQLVKATTGGTNYDYAFQLAYETAEKIHTSRGNDVYIVFMTDGVPTHYNGVYYKSRSNTDLTACMQYVDPASGERSSYTSTGNDRNGNDIDSTATQSITVYYNDGTTATKTVTYNKGWSDYVTNNLNGWAEKVKALDYIAHVYAIGFGMKNGSVTQGATDSMPTQSGKNGGTYYIPSSVTHTTLQHIASDADSHFEADDLEELSKLYADIATQIKYAGTSAQVTDLIGDGFTLQMASTISVDSDIRGDVTLGDYGITPKITIKAYELWTKEETTDSAMIGTRKADVDPTEIEIVTFNEDGTEAYSNLIDDGETNIMTTLDDGTVIIAAKYFTYTQTPEGDEDLQWIIGNITDKELAFSFLVYLEGSLDGKVTEGLKYTNESAKLEYIDINGNYASAIFQSPAAAWGGASTAYEFYLVNDDGKPCDRNGNEIPFANRVIISGPYFEELSLNQKDQNEAESIIATHVLPAGYTLYDASAMYTVVTASGDNEGSLTISTPAEGKAQTTIVVSATAPSYIQSRVAFGVKYNEIPTESKFALTPDLVVIDYCKPIQINTTGNNTEVPEGSSTELVGFYKFYASVDQKTQYSETSCLASFNTSYGTFSISDDGKAIYTPTSLVEDVEKVFAVYMINEEDRHDTYYMVNEVTVIPATVMYYETDGTAYNEFTYVDNWTVDGDFQTGNQDDYVSDSAGGKQIYGFDSSYKDDPNLSNGSSKYVAGKSTAAGVLSGSPETVAKFSFKGTGFDLIARTGMEQATLRVHMTGSSGTTKTISVICKGTNELWQIPVISVKGQPYDTYTVEIIVYGPFTPAANSGFTQEMIDQMSRGNQFFFDAIRIYDPVKGNATAEAAYAADGEAYQTISQIGSLLVDLNTYETLGQGAVGTGAVFMDSYTLDSEVDTNIGTSETNGFVQTSAVGTYQKYGPNNEVYLGKNQGIAFILDTNGTIPSSIQIGAKSITGANVKLNAKLVAQTTSGNLTNTENPIEQTITTSTAMYYELSSEAELKTMFANGNQVYVVIWNTEDSVLSVTDIKFAYKQQPSQTVTFLYSADLATAAAEVISEFDEETYLRKFGDGWYYCDKDGNVIEYSGLAETTDSGIWYVVNGKVDFDYIGLFTAGTGKCYSIRSGRVETDLNGIAERSDYWLYFTDGIVDTSFTGIASYGDTGEWYVKNGEVQFDYSGTVTLNGIEYRIEQGKVVQS